jgi:hypothetical protein
MAITGTTNLWGGLGLGRGALVERSLHLGQLLGEHVVLCPGVNECGGHCVEGEGLQALCLCAWVRAVAISNWQYQIQFYIGNVEKQMSDWLLNFGLAL